MGDTALVNTMNSESRSKLIIGAVIVGLVGLGLARGSIGQDTIIFLAVLVPSVILHEVSHGAVAFMFGDDTAKRAGRLTLNPISHIDPVGTVLIPAMLALSGFPPFGYAKPVPVNVRQLRSPRNQTVLVSLAGPATNIVLALVAVVATRAVLHPFVLNGAVFSDNTSLWGDVILSFGLVNVVLAAFNLIPLPPLDGSAVIERFLPHRLWASYLRFRKYSMLVLFAVVFLLPRGVGLFIDPARDLFFRLIA